MKKFIMLVICTALLVAALLIPTFGEDKALAGEGKGKSQSVQSLKELNSTLWAFCGEEVFLDDGTPVECKSMTIQMTSVSTSSSTGTYENGSYTSSSTSSISGTLYINQDGFFETVSGTIYSASYSGEDNARLSYFFDMDIYQSYYQWYCSTCEHYYTDSEAEDGVCPECGRAMSNSRYPYYAFRMRRFEMSLATNTDSETIRMCPSVYNKWVTFDDDSVYYYLREADLHNAALAYMDSLAEFLDEIVEKKLDWTKTYNATKEEVASYYESIMGESAKDLDGSVTVDLSKPKAPRIVGIVSYGVSEGDAHYSVYDKTESIYTNINNTVIGTITSEVMEIEQVFETAYDSKESTQTDDEE